MAAAIAALDDHAVARVSLDLPLRANLSALDNIGLIPLYQRHCGALDSARQAQALLDAFAHPAIAPLRDPDMSAAQRFVVKLARAVILNRKRLVIDRPGAMLYDVDYPAFIGELSARAETGSAWEIFDYGWNRALYPADMEVVAAHE
jgi:ABC-type sugar transport system ATPase subunit